MRRKPFCTWEGTHAASAAAIETFLARIYELVADGAESEYMDFDAELAELLSQA